MRTSAPERISDAQAVVRFLEELGVEVVFGTPGGAVLPLYDPIYDSEKLRHVLTRHEQGAGHAVTGYAQVSGKIGIYIAASGPGITNLVTPFTDARVDSVPVVAITGQVGRPLPGTGASQEADIRGVTMPITKHDFMVTEAGDTPYALAEAFYLASPSRPGPILVDAPKDPQNTMIDFTWPPETAPPGCCPVVIPYQRQIGETAEIIATVKCPVFYIGGSVIKTDAFKELVEFAEQTGASVVTTLMVRGIFPDSHPLHMGIPGIHGKASAITTLQKSGLLIMIGARFDDRVTDDLNSSVPNTKVVHADIDPAEIGKFCETDIPIVDDAREALAAPSESYTKLGLSRPQTTDQLKLPDGLRDGFPLGWEEPADDAIVPQFVIRTLPDIVDPEAIYAADVGQHQVWTTQFARYENPHTWFNSGGAGTMGYSISAAMGTKAAVLKKEVWAIDGDGCFQMTDQELIICAMESFPIKAALINNNNLDMARQWQALFYDRRYSNTKLRPEDNSYLPDFVQFSEGLGCVAVRVTKKEDVAVAIKKVREISGRPVVIDFIVGEDAQMWPMVTAGKSNDEVEYAYGLCPLFNDESSATETPADIHGAVVDNAEDVAKRPDVSRPSVKTR